MYIGYRQLTSLKAGYNGGFYFLFHFDMSIAKINNKKKKDCVTHVQIKPILSVIMWNVHRLWHFTLDAILIYIAKSFNQPL